MILTEMVPGGSSIRETSWVHSAVSGKPFSSDATAESAQAVKKHSIQESCSLLLVPARSAIAPPSTIAVRSTLERRASRSLYTILDHSYSPHATGSTPRFSHRLHGLLVSSAGVCASARLLDITSSTRASL